MNNRVGKKRKRIAHKKDDSTQQYTAFEVLLYDAENNIKKFFTLDEQTNARNFYTYDLNDFELLMKRDAETKKALKSAISYLKRALNQFSDKDDESEKGEAIKNLNEMQAWLIELNNRVLSLLFIHPDNSVLIQNPVYKKMKPLLEENLKLIFPDTNNIKIDNPFIQFLLENEKYLSYYANHFRILGHLSYCFKGDLTSATDFAAYAENLYRLALQADDTAALKKLKTFDILVKDTIRIRLQILEGSIAPDGAQKQPRKKLRVELQAEPEETNLARLRAIKSPAATQDFQQVQNAHPAVSGKHLSLLNTETLPLDHLEPIEKLFQDDMFIPRMRLYICALRHYPELSLPFVWEKMCFLPEVPSRPKYDTMYVIHSNPVKIYAHYTNGDFIDEQSRRAENIEYHVETLTTLESVNLLKYINQFQKNNKNFFKSDATPEVNTELFKDVADVPHLQQLSILLFLARELAKLSQYEVQHKFIINYKIDKVWIDAAKIFLQFNQSPREIYKYVNTFRDPKNKHFDFLLRARFIRFISSNQAQLELSRKDSSQKYVIFRTSLQKPDQIIANYNYDGEFREISNDQDGIFEQPDLLWEILSIDPALKDVEISTCLIPYPKIKQIKDPEILKKLKTVGGYLKVLENLQASTSPSTASLTTFTNLSRKTPEKATQQSSKETLSF